MDIGRRVMPAPDFFTLYDFETQIEGCVESVLTAALAAAGLSAVELSTTRSPDINATPRVDIQFNSGAATGHWTTQGQANPKQVPDMFEGILVLTVATTRPLPTDNGNLHGQIRGLVRYNLTAAAKVMNHTNLPYLQILDILPASSASLVSDEKEQDMTQINFRVVFAIDPAAWPASP